MSLVLLTNISEKGGMDSNAVFSRRPSASQYLAKRAWRLLLLLSSSLLLDSASATPPATGSGLFFVAAKCQEGCLGPGPRPILMEKEQAGGARSRSRIVVNMLPFVMLLTVSAVAKRREAWISRHSKLLVRAS